MNRLMAGVNVLLIAGVWLVATRLDAQDYEFAAPVRLKAGGEVIDTGKYVAHAGPAFADINNDGKMDLLVGNFSGLIEYFENTGSASEPVYAAGKMLETEGKPIKIHNW